MSSINELKKNNKLHKKGKSFSKDKSSQNIEKLIETKITESDRQKKNTSFILPPLNLSFKKKAFLEPTSILTKFIQKKTSDLIKQTNKNLHKSKIFNFSSSNIISSSKKIKSNKDKIIKNNNSQELNSKVTLPSKNLFITEKTTINNNDDQNYININENLQIIQSDKQDDFINNNNNIDNQVTQNNINKKEESFINEKELKELIPTKSFPSSKKISNPLTSNNEPNSSDININFQNENKIFSSKFRRLCKYLPNIKNKSMSKSYTNKKLNISGVGLTYIYDSDVKFQSKIFNEQINLIEDNFNQYKQCINKNNFLDVFKSMPLNTKIKYNKSLEEIFGILLLLPKLILGNYYNLMYDLKEINFPKKENFQSSYVFDEEENLIKNINLLNEVHNFLKKSFEFYLILVSKPSSYDLPLNQRNYFKVLSYFEKVRNNIFYIINSFYNAEKNLNEDILVINKIINNKNISLINDEDLLEDSYYNDLNIKKTKKKEIKSKVIDRMKEQILFKRSKEMERKIRINSALGLDNKDNKSFNYLGKEIKNKKNQFKSIFDSKLVDKLLYYFDKETRIKIISNKINNDEKNSQIKKYKVIKINY